MIIAPLTLRCSCGSDDWIACAPGTVAEEQQQGNLFVLQPAPEVPMRVWCLAHWKLAFPIVARSAA